MANLIEVTTLLDGPRNFIYHVYLRSDGEEGDLDSYELVPPHLDPAGKVRVYSIDDITWGFNGFAGKLHFELLVDDTLIWVLPNSTGNYVDFKKYGGLKDRGNPLDASGKILFSTIGFENVGDEGSMVINVRRR